eukprot:363974-Chlamydomonas_euryale.AAC.2
MCGWWRRPPRSSHSPICPPTQPRLHWPHTQTNPCTQSPTTSPLPPSIHEPPPSPHLPPSRPHPRAGQAHVWMHVGDVLARRLCSCHVGCLGRGVEVKGTRHHTCAAGRADAQRAQHTLQRVWGTCWGGGEGGERRRGQQTASFQADRMLTRGANDPAL